MNCQLEFGPRNLELSERKVIAKSICLIFNFFATFDAISLGCDENELLGDDEMIELADGRSL